MTEKVREVRQGTVVKDRLSLLVGARYDIPNSSQGRGLNLNFPVSQQWYQLGDHSGVDHHLNLLVSSIGQVTQCPHSIDQDLAKRTNKARTRLWCRSSSFTGSHVDIVMVD